MIVLIDVNVLEFDLKSFSSHVPHVLHLRRINNFTTWFVLCTRVFAYFYLLYSTCMSYVTCKQKKPVSINDLEIATLFSGSSPYPSRGRERTLGTRLGCCSTPLFLAVTEQFLQCLENRNGAL